MTECLISLGKDGELQLTIPSTSGEQIVHIPPTLGGLSVLKRILRARASAPDPQFGRKLNTHSEPTQALVNAWLRADAQAKQDELLAQIDFDIEVNL